MNRPVPPIMLRELAHAVVALVHAHQLAEVDDAVGGEEGGEVVPQAEVDDAAVAREQLVDGEAVVGGELAHGLRVLSQLENALQARLVCAPAWRAGGPNAEAAEFVERLAPRWGEEHGAARLHLAADRTRPRSGHARRRQHLAQGRP